MSKLIKQMEMDALSGTFKDVRDLIMLSMSGLNATLDNQLRLGLRKKGIRLQVIKNSLAQKVFDKLGLKITKGWDGVTLLAWGGSSIAELSKEVEGFIKKNDKIFKVKNALADGREISFEQALKMPTRSEAIGRIVQLALSPASRLVSQILGPAASVASQIKSIAEKKEAAPAPAA
jgi:large subunit ribosomal protein L10